MGISKDKIDQVMSKDLQINRVGLKNVQERIRSQLRPRLRLTVIGGRRRHGGLPCACPAPDREKGGAPCS